MSMHNPDALDASFDAGRPIDVDEVASPVSMREAERELAREVPEDQLKAPSETLSASGVDPALRLQDGVGTWPDDGDTSPEEVGNPDPGGQLGPDPEPYVPLVGSGGEGI